MNEQGQSTAEGKEKGTEWGGTPALRTLWSNQRKEDISFVSSSALRSAELEESSALLGENSGAPWGGGARMGGSLYGAAEDVEDGGEKEEKSVEHTLFTRCFLGTPGLLIATVLNLFLSMSFGQAFFPTGWDFPPEVPRAIGVQMFLFSTLIAQLVMTALSDFDAPMGMMMVENIPFLHTISEMAVRAQGPGVGTFSTVLVTFSLSTVVVGLFFYLLGHFKVGTAVYFFPRHVIIGCIGGIGIFIMTTGIEVSADHAWSWDPSALEGFLARPVLDHWAASLAFVLLLRLVQAMVHAPLLPPFFFVAIPPAFYLLLWLLDVPVQQARDNEWFFPQSEDVDPFLIWELIDFGLVDWSVVGASLPTIIALTVFSLMHVPINIPSLSMSTHQDVDMNRELIAHGYSNLLSGLCGGLQNYLCYSNSLLYFKCGGGGKVSGYLMCVVIAIFFYLGPSVVFYMPRVMPGCLLIHIGIDLTTEALYDSWGAFDIIEYSSIVAITVTMTFYGMTAGLGLGVICAALTFTLQTSRHVYPIRGKMCGRTLRSSRWRTPADAFTLNGRTRHIMAVQLQGHLFFGNATLLAEEIERMLDAQEQGQCQGLGQGQPQGQGLGQGQQQTSSLSLWFIVLDFTLVVGIDSSAAETIGRLFKMCRARGVRLCYSAGGEGGFPCTFPLSATIHNLNSERLRIPDSNCCGKCGASHTLRPLDDEKNKGYTSPSRKVAAGVCRCSECGTLEDFTRSKWVYLAENLDAALGWCEDVIIAEERLRCRLPPAGWGGGQGGGGGSQVLGLGLGLGLGQEGSPSPSPSASPSPDARPIPEDIPPYLHQIYLLSGAEPRQKIGQLLAYFTESSADAGSVLWVQGAASDRAVLLISGRLQHQLEEEAETKETVYPGHLVGEYGLLNQAPRLGRLIALEDCRMLVLHLSSFQQMARNDPYLAVILSKVCMAYLGRRVMHVANRIWESKCLPV